MRSELLAPTSIKTIGRRYAAFNGVGWVVIQYTIWQAFGYNGTQITYTPAPTPCRGLGRPTPVDVRQDCRRADRPDKHVFRRFDFELQEVRFLIGQRADLVSARNAWAWRGLSVAEVRTLT